MIGSVWPEKDSSAAGVRSWQLIRAMREQDWDIHVCSPAKPTAFTDSLRQDSGVHTLQVRVNHDSFDGVVAQLKPDFVIFDRFLMEEQFGWRVRQAWPSSICVIDTQDLHFIRRERMKALEQGKSMEEIVDIHIPPTSPDMLREISSIRRSDLTLVVSSWEKELLVRRYGIPEHSLQLAPFYYDEPPGLQELPGWDRRHNFFMLGNFRHPPNWDSFHWTFHHIWPLIRARLPDAKLHVYGAYPDKASVLLSSADKGFVVKGVLPPERLHSTIRRHRVNLAPLRFGAGIKGKIADGWWSGLPCVTTPIGAEGMQSVTDWGGAIGRTAEEIADRAVALYSDQEHWSRAQMRGRALVEELFSHRVNAPQLIRSLNQAAARGSNAARFAQGEMDLDLALVYYNSNKANEFFSKSIMAKQKLRAQQHSTTTTMIGTGALPNHDHNRDDEHNLV